MAYYLVKYEGKHYVNRELAKAHYGVGDAGLFALIADGALVQKKILDCYVYGEGAGCPKKIPKPGKVDAAIYQNLDEQTAFVVGFCGPGTEDKIDYIVPAQHAVVYRFEGAEYIRMKDVYDPMKYRMFNKFPTVTFLGQKYIAINAASKDSDFIVRIKK